MLFLVGCQKITPPENKETPETTWSIEQITWSAETTGQQFTGTENERSGSQSASGEDWDKNTNIIQQKIKNMIERRKQEMAEEKTGSKSDTDLTEKDIQLLQNILDEMTKK